MMHSAVILNNSYSLRILIVPIEGVGLKSADENTLQELERVAILTAK
jgi:hypothetical protein